MLAVARYTNIFQMTRTCKMKNHTNWRDTEGQQTGCTHTYTCCTFVIAHFRIRPNARAQHSHTPHQPTSAHTHTQAQPTTGMTSACLGYNHSGNSNYIIERVAARGTLLITQCFQLLEAALLHIYWSSKACTLLLGFIKMGQLINTAINRFTAKMNGDWKSLAVCGSLASEKPNPTNAKADSFWCQLFVTYF